MKQEKTRRFEVSFLLEVTSKPGPWRFEWGPGDVAARVARSFYEETGGGSSKTHDIRVKELHRGGLSECPFCPYPPETHLGPDDDRHPRGFGYTEGKGLTYGHIWGPGAPSK